MKNPETKWQQTYRALIALVASAVVLPILGLWKAVEAVAKVFERA